jgi:hypothetical protein
VNRHKLIDELFKRSGAIHTIGIIGNGGLHGYQIGNCIHGGYFNERSMKEAWAREEIGDGVIKAMLSILKEQEKKLKDKGK